MMSSTPQKKARILIVEDEAVVAEDLEMTITNIGYEVVGRAGSAKDAVKKTLELKPDLVLMDIILSGRGNGIDASYEIKERTDIPIIFLTAYSDVEQIDRAKTTEPYAYLVKPFQERQLLASIEMALYKSRTEKELIDSEERLRLVAENMPVMLDAFDDKGNIIVWNSECEEVTGFKSTELIGNPEAAKLLYPDEYHKDYIASMLKKHGSDFRNMEWDITCKDGSVKTILWSNISKKYPIPGWYSWEIGIDITDRKRAEEKLKRLTISLQEHVEKLEESKKQIGKAYSLREHFLKETSHRIVTPVSIIGGYTDLLIESADFDDDQKDYIRIIRERNEEIEKLVRDALAGKYLEEEY